MQRGLKVMNFMKGQELLWFMELKQSVIILKNGYKYHNFKMWYKNIKRYSKYPQKYFRSICCVFSSLLQPLLHNSDISTFLCVSSLCSFNTHFVFVSQIHLWIVTHSVSYPWLETIISVVIGWLNCHSTWSGRSLVDSPVSQEQSFVIGSLCH